MLKWSNILAIKNTEILIFALFCRAIKKTNFRVPDMDLIANMDQVADMNLVDMDLDGKLTWI